jgi:hypothetical protein
MGVRLRRAPVVIAGVAICTALVGCGGSDSPTTTTSKAAAKSAPAVDALMATSEKVADSAASSVIWGKATGFVEPDTLGTDNAGGVAPIKAAPGKARTVYFIAQGPTATFQAISKIMTNVGTKLGWRPSPRTSRRSV